MTDKKVKILIIDDDILDIEIVEELLIEYQRFKFNLEYCHTFVSGLNHLARKRVDIILLDLFLQDGSSGIDNLHHLYQLHQDTPVVILTGLDDEETATAALRDGAQDYLIKGKFDCALLGRTLQYAIERHQMLVHIEEKNQALKRSEQELRYLIERNHDGIVILDEEGRIQFANSAAMELLNLSPSQMHQIEFGIPIVSTDLIEVDIPSVGEAPKNAELRLVELTWEGQRAFLASLRDTTYQKLAEASLHKLAYSDPLTNLANRTLFMDRLGLVLARAQRHANQPCAVMFIDLDHFKKVNDTLGHSAGDELLIYVGQQLSACIRPEDTLARLGGDEFAIILESINEVRDAVTVAKRILTRLSKPCILQGHECHVSGSIGIVSSQNQVTGDSYTDIETLLRDADIAMYRAKQEGKARYAIFDYHSHSEAMADFQLESELRRAVVQDELCLFYQPIVDLHSGKILGFEALVRWQHPQRGILCPNSFIPLAEKTDLITQIDAWVFEKACKQLKLWKNLGLECEIQSLSVNISGRRLSQPSLIENVQNALKLYDISPHLIQLEITEDVILASTSQVIQSLRFLRMLGFKLSIDDFGTGYSSLSRLHTFPLDTLKVDRSFLLEAMRQPQHWSIIEAIITVATKLGLKAIAEGVESFDQCERLRHLSCSAGQGYYFSKPVNSITATTMLKSNATRNFSWESLQNTEVRR